jgi:ribosome-binding factor A
MAKRRQRKMAELLHEEISHIILYQSQDPRLALVTITAVEITVDLQRAIVYFTVLGVKADTKEALVGLGKAAGFVRHQLGQSLSLRRVPELTFKVDTSLERGLQIESLLDELKKVEDSAEAGFEA